MRFPCLGEGAPNLSSTPSLPRILGELGSHPQCWHRPPARTPFSFLLHKGKQGNPEHRDNDSPPNQQPLKGLQTCFPDTQMDRQIFSTGTLLGRREEIQLPRRSTRGERRRRKCQEKPEAQHPSSTHLLGPGSGSLSLPSGSSQSSWVNPQGNR